MGAHQEEERFWGKVRKGDGCWEWCGTRDSHGYGVLSFGGTGHKKAHRVSWELCAGLIPDGLFVCHHCDNPSCVNPAHLFLGTPRDNYEDMVAKGRRAPLLRGESHPNSVLTWDGVLSARAAWEAGEPQRSIADRLGVSQSSISGALTGETWGPTSYDPAISNKRRGRRGEKHPKAKLTEEQVLEIRSLFGCYSQEKIARWYGVSQTLVSKIGKRDIWAHLP